jgi:hypothetical protein
MWVIYWALAFAIVVISLAVAIAVILRSTRDRSTDLSEGDEAEPVAQLKPTQPDVVKSFEDELSIVRSARFGRNMQPVQRRVPERFRKE